ncbi:hypothetical protein N7449_011110 [Penicillium cf. viridicatum]|uniref:Xylanolytic transcriptional activator regulatory domain-containing protein n=1 Tax=Penicillium cf. viridicatum TaxID=2972119 RepID=A0A9W9J2I8_9EURO|nr:hypothetical protein N7449_011110 [Penicillium cf. viridicatum]
MDESDPRLAHFWSQLPSSPTQVPATVYASRRLLRTAMTCLLQDNFFINHKFSTFEALLMVIYNLSHNESVDQGWALLGMALNIGIALRCNVGQNLSPIETERRRRCWAGLLTLHTYQGMLFRDVDMSYLLDIKSSLPADVNDSDITDEGILHSSSRGQPTQMGQTGTANPPTGGTKTLESQFEILFDEWTDIREWIDMDLINWNLDGAFNVFAP